LNGQSLTTALSVYLQRLPHRDQALASELAYGCCRWYHRLNGLARLCIQKPLRDKDQDIHCLLLVGLYQLIYLRIPNHAAVSETVNASRHLDKAWAAGLLNGVMRRFQREQEAFEQKLDQDPVTRYAIPAWLVTRLRSSWPETWEAMAENLLARPPMSLRVNQAKTSVDQYQQLLAEHEISASIHPAVSSALVLKSPMDAKELPGLAQGLVSVQDVGAQCAAELLEVGRGQSVLDVCAAPGGKTGHLLELYPDCDLTAVDIDPERLKRVQENLGRLGLVAGLFQGDAARPEGIWADKRYDRILLDVPCSATGVIRRHPDIKLLKRESDIPALVSRQAEILNAIWPRVKAKGRLLYATCSILAEENEQQVEHFLQMHSNAVSVPIERTFGQQGGAGWQILPGEQNMDGFFYALIEKID